MYFWMTSSPKTNSVKREVDMWLSKHALLGNTHAGGAQLQQKHDVDDAILNAQDPAVKHEIRLVLAPEKDNKSKMIMPAQRLFIMPERDNNNNSQAAKPASNFNVVPGDDPGQAVQLRRGGDLGRTLRPRLESVFHSVLDCPQKLPLTFLGMDSLSADLSQDPACPWIKASVRNVEENFVALGGEMAVLRSVTLNPESYLGTKGGEAIEEVFQQQEGKEYFKVRKGFFSLPCSSSPKGVQFHVEKTNYRRSNHLNHWLSTLTCTEVGRAAAKRDNDTAERSASAAGASHVYVPGVTFALQRYEYANIYHTMLDWYNTFIAALILGIDPQAATYLIVDGHPWGKLDPTWATLFGGRGALRAGHLPSPTTFQYLVWVANGYHCPLFDRDRTTVPFLPELREYFFKVRTIPLSIGYWPSIHHPACPSSLPSSMSSFFCFPLLLPFLSSLQSFVFSSFISSLIIRFLPFFCPSLSDHTYC